MAYPSIATKDTSQADENGVSMITADVQNRSSLMVNVYSHAVSGSKVSMHNFLLC